MTKLKFFLGWHFGIMRHILFLLLEKKNPYLCEESEIYDICISNILLYYWFLNTEFLLHILRKGL